MTHIAITGITNVVPLSQPNSTVLTIYSADKWFLNENMSVNQEQRIETQRLHFENYKRKYKTSFE